MDGTLLDKHFDDHFWTEYFPKRYSEIKGLDVKHIQNNLQKYVEKFAGTLNWYSMDFWSQLLKVDVIELQKELTHLISVRPHTIEFLQSLRDNKYRAVLATNSSQQLLDLKLKHSNLDKYLDGIITSHELGFPKEDINFWRKLNEVEKFNPENTLFVDDDLRVLSAAKEYGVSHLVAVLKPNSKLDAFPATDKFKSIHYFNEIMPLQMCAE